MEVIEIDHSCPRRRDLCAFFCSFLALSPPNSVLPPASASLLSPSFPPNFPPSFPPTSRPLFPRKSGTPNLFSFQSLCLFLFLLATLAHPPRPDAILPLTLFDSLPFSPVTRPFTARPSTRPSPIVSASCHPFHLSILLLRRSSYPSFLPHYHPLPPRRHPLHTPHKSFLKPTHTHNSKFLRAGGLAVRESKMRWRSMKEASLWSYSHPFRLTLLSSILLSSTSPPSPHG